MSQSSAIPFLDLVTPHAELKEELMAVVESTFATAGFVGGPMVEAFEQDWAAFCGTNFAVGVGSGTDAVRFALMAAGVRETDIVITVPNTFIATTEAITQAGARPAFVDIDERTYNMDPERLRGFLETDCVGSQVTGETIHRQSGRRVSAVVPVHLYGQPADMDPILELAERHKLVVVEDACQAHGAEYFSRKEQRWRKAGTMGKAAGFSFYPGKNLGACGEAGAVTTDDPEIAQQVRMLRDHGQRRKYYHELEGYNGRLDAIQAGFLCVKVRHLAAWNEQRREAAMRYQALLGPAEPAVTLPWEPSWAKSIFHLYVIRVSARAQMQVSMTTARIGTGIHYPIPLHLQSAYSHLGYSAGSLPVSERVSGEILSLPMFPGLGESAQNRVAQVVLDSVCLAAHHADEVAG